VGRAFQQQIVEIHPLGRAGDAHTTALPLPALRAIARRRFAGIVAIGKHDQRAINQKLDELIDKAHGGVGLRHVTKGRFEETEIDLPPLQEQRRIVAKLDDC
jgi:Type I restriction modification DNA specificity domain